MLFYTTHSQRCSYGWVPEYADQLTLFKPGRGADYAPNTIAPHPPPDSKSYLHHSVISKSVFRYRKVPFYPTNIDNVSFYGKFIDIDIDAQY